MTLPTRTRALIAAGAVAATVVIGGGAAALNVGLITATTDAPPTFRPAADTSEPLTVADTTGTTGTVEVVYQDVYDVATSGGVSPAPEGSGAADVPAAVAPSPTAPRPPQTPARSFVDDDDEDEHEYGDEDEHEYEDDDDEYDD